VKIDYENETRDAYQSHDRAMAYRRHLTEEISWARFTMWREKYCIAKALKLCKLSSWGKILDVPCGTGIMASTIKNNCIGRYIASDISLEMIKFAQLEYSSSRFDGFVRADITNMPFHNKSFSGTIVVGFMHRVPPEIRQKALEELSRVSERFIIISYSVNSIIQKMKKAALSRLSQKYSSAPSPVSTKEIIREFERLDLKILKRFHVFRGLSSEAIYVLEKS